MSANRGGGDWVSLSLGVMLVLGTIAWGQFVASIYGSFGSSILQSSQYDFSLLVLYLVLGPLSGMLAAIVMFWNHRVGALWLIGGGLGSLVIVVTTGEGIWLTFFVSAPMVACGLRGLLPPRVDEELIALSRPEPASLLPSRADEELIELPRPEPKSLLPSRVDEAGKVYQRTDSPVLSMYRFVCSFLVGICAVWVLFVLAGGSGLLGEFTRAEIFRGSYRHEGLFINSIAIVATVLAALCCWVSQWTRIPPPAILGLATGMLGSWFYYWL